MNLTQTDVGRVVKVTEEELGTVWDAVLIGWTDTHASVAFPDTAPPAVVEVEWPDVAQITDTRAVLKRCDVGPVWGILSEPGEEPGPEMPYIEDSFPINTTLVFEHAEEGGYSAYVAELPGIKSHGVTMEVARENALLALRMLLEYRREKVRKKADEREAGSKP